MSINARWPIQSIILMILSISILVIGLAGCNQHESNTSGQTTSGQTSIVQTATNNPTYIKQTASPTTSSGQASKPTTGQQTPTSSQAENRTRFTQEDLTVNGIRVGATPQAAEQVLGAPNASKTEKDMLTDFDVRTYTYDGLQLIFMNDGKTDTSFHLKYVEVTGRTYHLARGLRVGDSAQNAIQLFFRENKDIKYQGYTVLYGDPVQLDRQDASGEIAFAYFNDQEARFLHMNPPYMTEQATVYDEMAVLNLTIENQIITKVFWMLGAGAE